MSAALVSLLALVAAITVSMVTSLNVGLVALALAWLVGLYASGMTGADALIARAFPSSLFLTLVGITVLFATAEANGTLGSVARRAGRLARGNRTRLGVILFLMACGLSAAGPGAVPSVALVAPIAMAVGTRAGISPFVIALLVANGANAGNLSPVSAVGVIANSRMAAAGVGGHPMKVMLANLFASLLVAVLGWLLFGRPARSPAESAKRVDLSGLAEPGPPAAEGRRAEGLTIAAIVVWVFGVIAFKWHLGLSALAVALVLIGLRAANEREALKRVPWGVVLMVCGVSTLVELLNATGGMDLFTSVLSRLATARTVNGVMAFVTGTISIYSSTSGVVLPAFLPTVPGLVAKLGGGEPLAVALSINVGSSLVDVSPLSTLGALCLAAAPTGTDARLLFRRLMLWGFAMAFVGALLCQLLGGFFARL